MEGSLSIDEGANSGSDEPETEVDVESGDGCRLLTGAGVGGMSIRDGLSIRLATRGWKPEARRE